MSKISRRRFDYSICFEELNNAQRISIWRNIVRKLKLGTLISEAQIADYAGKYATSAGGISTVLANVKRMRPTKGAVDELVAATNFCANLDAAIMRRFTFKLEFGYLDDTGKKLFFERLFKTKLTDDEFADLKTLQNLAPGDFRTVRQKTFYLNVAQTNADRIAALREECLLKRDGGQCRPIGFTA